MADEQVDCHVCGAHVHKACNVILKEQNLVHIVPSGCINELCSILCCRCHGSDEIDSSEVRKCREEFFSYNKMALKKLAREKNIHLMCHKGGKCHDLPKDASIQKLLEAVFLADAAHWVI